ncbi:46 kDa FK506-binding nuclear protein [Armadillidium vulgare]|nr:46 kDa FK506-binding nuclear protein [Armadillidium vulgare]
MSGKSYKQTVLKDYRVSHAVLDMNTVTEKEEKVVSLLVEVNGSSFILCNLSVDHGILQVPLEYNFSKGEVVVFSIRSENEEAVVHLSGYTINTSCTDCKGKIDVNGVSPLTNVTNLKSKTVKNVNRICKNEPSIKEEKENEVPLENKQTDSKSSDKKTSQKIKNKKPKSKRKIPTLTEMLNSIDEEEDEDDDYTPEFDEDAEAEEEENENEEMGEEEEENEEEEEEELNLEEEEEESDDSDDESLKMEDDLKESKDDDDDIVKILPKKKKRHLSPSSAGRTPIPKASKKPKIQVISGSTTNEISTNKKKNKKSPSSDSTFGSENVFMKRTPEGSEKKNDTSSSGEKSDASESAASKGRKRFCMGGVIIEDLVIGTGAKASKGKRVSVYYEGKLQNGKVFDQKKSGSCFKFKIGANEVIKAWEVGIVGMKVGGKRRIVAPPGMAYGREGCPPEIPPKAILTFEVELKGVN